MCERPGFWQWLPRALNRATRGLIGNPFIEFIIGMMTTWAFLWVAAVEYTLTMNMRVASALLSVPSFLMMMHGFYRMELMDCARS